MWPLAIFLMLVVLFYWLAFMGTIWFWFNAIVSLCKCNLIRSAIWACLGYGMLAWWQGSDVIPDPWDFDKWLRGSAVFVGVGALATFVRWRKKQLAIQTIPTMPTWPIPSGNVVPFIKVKVEHKRD